MELSSLFSLDSKVALVTGGTRGIGRMMAGGLLDAGASVVIVSRSATACQEAADELSPRGQVIALPIDISRAEGRAELVAAVAAAHPRIDILVNNAGTAWGEPFEQFSELGWDKTLTLNTKVPFFLTQQLMPLLAAGATPEDPSRVINIGSIDGLQVSGGTNYSYSVSKAGLHHLTRVLAKELADRHILVNAIAPGPFETKMLAPMLADHAERIVASSPLGRIGTEDDIAGALIYLTSRASSWVTGTVLPVDGGIATTLATGWTADDS